MSKYSYSPDIKPEAYRPPTREQIEGAREWYRQGFTVSRILARWDMALGTLYYWLDGGPVVGADDSARSQTPGAPHPNPLPTGEREQAENGARLLPPIPRRKQVLGKRRRPLKGDRVSLTARLWRTAERQVRDIEERLARPAASSPERERDVRMLASLVRALRDLSAFDACGPTDKGGPAAPPPRRRTNEELDASLARKLEAIIAEQDNEAASVP